MNISDKAKGIVDSCRFCWMCRHLCPVGNATGQERNTARARALAVSLVVRGAEKIDEVVDNIYECTLCGACTNNCVTGWDPKVFIQETKTAAVMEGATPAYIMALIEKYAACGNIYGAEICSCLDSLFGRKADTLFFPGADALFCAPEAVKNAAALLERAGVSFTLDREAVDSGETLWFLSGKTAETQAAMQACAAMMNKYKTVVVYDPADLALMLHEYREWGVEVSAKLVSFNDYLLSLIEEGKLSTKKGENVYTLQDSYAYARELDDCTSGRALIAACGENREMLLVGKEANLAGNLIMNCYMPSVMADVARNRWVNARNMDCFTLVTENPAEYVLLRENAPEGFRVITVEEMLLENL